MITITLMNVKKVNKLKRRLRNRLPLVGRWVARRAARSLAADGSGEAALALTEGVAEDPSGCLFDWLIEFCSSEDPELSRSAAGALGRVMAGARGGEAFEVISTRLCAKWFESRDGRLEDVIVRGRYVASRPLELKVFSCLKTKQNQQVAVLGAEVVAPLLAACRDGDKQMAEEARAALGRLKKAEAKDEVCRLALEAHNELAFRATLVGKYAPRDEHKRALFFFLTEQWERYDSLDYDRRLLLEVYESAAPPLRKRITEKLRASGRTDFLAVIAGHESRRRTGVMKTDEISLLLQMLEANREWPKLWALVFELPFAWSVRVVRTLSRCGWKPDPAD